MEKSLLKLECLKLAQNHREADDVIAKAKKFYDYVTEDIESVSTPPVPKDNSDKSIPPIPGVGPEDDGKDHKLNSKK